jgi:O-antigen/teichoic acid export membrane protein
VRNYFNLSKSQIIRHTGYLFWTIMAQALDLGLTRVVLFPLVIYIAGKEEFGVFAIALSVVMIVGIQPATGLITGLLRHMAEYSEEKRAQFYQTAMRLNHIAMTVVIALGLLIIAILWQTSLVPPKLLKCILPLAISLYTENQFALALTELRYLRKFKSQALWHGLRSGCVLCGALPGAIINGAIGAAWGFSAGLILSYVILCLRRGHWMRFSYNTDMAEVLKKVWFHVTMAGIIALSGPYLNRIILSANHGFTNVAELVAATSVKIIFTMLITNIGFLTLSLISRYPSVEKLTTRVKAQYLLITGASILGPLLLRIMYPTIFDESLRLFYIVIWTIPFTILTSLMRPITMKFAPIKITPLVNTVSLAATLVPSVILVPRYYAYGAAWAIVIGETVTGLLWLAAALKVLLFTKTQAGIETGATAVIE